MKYDYIISAIVLGPSNSGKTTLINTYSNKKKSDYATIGIDFYKFQFNYNNNFYQLKLWDTGNGLLYRNIIDDFLKKANIYIIINNDKKYDFINKIFDITYYNNPQLILFIYNKTVNTDNFKYNETYIKKLNKNTNIFIEFFYIDLTNKNQVQQVFNFIKEYINNLNYNKNNIMIKETNKLSCCSIC